MIENWKESLDQGGHYGALLTDLSKAFDCIIYDLLIAKLQVHGFYNDFVNVFFFWNCLSKIEYDVPQRSILGLLLFNMNVLDMFFAQKDVNFAAYADDNTPHFYDKNLEILPFPVSFRYVH